MKVICNTTVISNFAAVNALAILRDVVRELQSQPRCMPKFKMDWLMAATSTKALTRRSTPLRQTDGSI